MIMCKSGELEDRSVFLETLFKDLIKIFRNLKLFIEFSKNVLQGKTRKKGGGNIIVPYSNGQEFCGIPIPGLR